MKSATYISAVADALIDAWDRATELPPITQSDPSFDVTTAYAVLREIDRRRVARGWRPIGRKIGFTNRTIWTRYGVSLPMWAHVWSETTHRATHGRATLPLKGFVAPRIEPEVVFGLRAPIRADADAVAAMDAVDWIAPGFEIVQSHFPNWKFTAADCTAAFGLHGALVIGARVAVTATNRSALADSLPTFELTLLREDVEVDRGVGANVLGGPAYALAHLVNVLADQPESPPLAAGEFVTTGTVTDAWPVAPGETWRSNYGALGIDGLELSFT